ncbi:hypothetical protein F8388_022846 [Cannabis sativa]|uniref:Uncharacterized protein n=1 Tax=Cannabis sativa TaxID=3483 RepID=A0A7J6FBY8_CANSA|nr:hypothetical protein F8388_022846 [Cannabis sativa]
MFRNQPHARFSTHLLNMKEEESEDEVKSVGNQIKVLGKKLCSTTIKCSSSLVFASIGSGIGAVLFRPSAGCWAGDLGGPIIVSICIEKGIPLMKS